MIDERTGLPLSSIPVLETGETYIYVMLNTCGKIKIGKSKNIQQRYLSLSGSNSQGNAIVKVYCSPPTFLHSLERILQNRFSAGRLKGTEWFLGQSITFSSVTAALEELFNSKNYERCNEIRKNIYQTNKCNNSTELTS